MITIVDSICGSGKTSWAIQEMNKNLNQKYIYITPYLDEVDRVVKECDDRYFYKPDEKLGQGKKMNHFIKMLKEGCNIVSTHALFRDVSRDTIELIKENNYTLILDEVMNIIEQIDIDNDDLQMLLNDNIIYIEEGSNKILWNPDKLNYKGKFKNIKNSILQGDVYYVRGSVVMWSFPVKTFEYFDDIYILTYLFKGQLQRAYYDMYNISYEYKSVQYVGTEGWGSLEKRVYELVEYKDADKTELRKLINIYNNKKKNMIGDKKGKENPLSAGWFARQVENKTDRLTILKNNIYYFFKNECKSKSKDNMYCVFKEYEQKCKGDGYSKGFVVFNKRATNEYRHKKNLAYCINLFINPFDKAFFTDKDVEVDEDTWALSELIQWMFRSQLRDGKPINIYIPSERMRNLLLEWLNE